MKKGSFFIIFGLGVVVWICLGMRLGFLYEKDSTGMAGQDAVKKEKAPTEDSKLFLKLLDAGLIRVEVKTGRLLLPPSDQGLVLLAHLRQSPDPEEERNGVTRNKIRLLKALFNSPAGYAVITQVELWNSTHLLSAVRDNRNQADGVFENHWVAHDGKNKQRELPSVRYVSEYFGFVNNGILKPGFSDWKAAAIEQGRGVRFTSALTLKTPTTLEVQVIGTPLAISPEAAPVMLSFKQEDTPQAFTVTYRLPKGNHFLEIITAPVISKEKRVPGQCIYRNKGTGQFEWRNIPRTKTHRGPGPMLSTADRVPLITESGKPAPFTQRSGLIPLVGFSSQDTSSLSGILARSNISKEYSDIGLTLESKIQEKAQQVLLKKLTSYWPADEDPYHDERKAAVVVVDADTGAILAAAGSPVPPENVNVWDLVSYAKTYPLKNPMVLRAWKGLDRHNAPGSTFKPVVALAALEAENGNSKIKKFIKGYSENELKNRNNASGLTLDSAAYCPQTGKCFSPRRIPGPGVRKISNFNRQTIFKTTSKNLTNGCREDAKERQSVMGLTEAVRDSVNIWFARLGVIMDGSLAIDYDTAMGKRLKGDPLPVYPQFQLVKMARKLGFGPQALDLAANIPREMDLKRNEVKKSQGEGDVLFAQAGTINLMNPKERGLLWVLAQNAIGQGMTASPLQMARVAASIATGRVVTPTIIGRINAIPLEATALGESLLPEKKLKVLRNAMKKVPTQGTARKSFLDHPDRCRMYGKTGTANVAAVENGMEKSQKTFFTTWFIGWREPIVEGGRRLAFACMVSHGHGRYKTGGGVCAPIIADILEGIE